MTHLCSALEYKINNVFCTNICLVTASLNQVLLVNKYRDSSYHCSAFGTDTNLDRTTEHSAKRIRLSYKNEGKMYDTVE